jgi:hypothetical protein
LPPVLYDTFENCKKDPERAWVLFREHSECQGAATAEVGGGAACRLQGLLLSAAQVSGRGRCPVNKVSAREGG